MASSCSVQLYKVALKLFIASHILFKFPGFLQFRHRACFLRHRCCCMMPLGILYMAEGLFWGMERAGIVWYSAAKTAAICGACPELLEGLIVGFDAVK